VEGFHVHINSGQAAFKESPEVLDAVRVGVAVNVFFGVVDDLMN
jgi:hypothetical protein